MLSRPVRRVEPRRHLPRARNVWAIGVVSLVAACCAATPRALTNNAHESGSAQKSPNKKSTIPSDSVLQEWFGNSPLSCAVSDLRYVDGSIRLDVALTMESLPRLSYAYAYMTPGSHVGVYVDRAANGTFRIYFGQVPVHLAPNLNSFDLFLHSSPDSPPGKRLLKGMKVHCADRVALSPDCRRLASELKSGRQPMYRVLIGYIPVLRSRPVARYPRTTSTASLYRYAVAAQRWAECRVRLGR